MQFKTASLVSASIAGMLVSASASAQLADPLKVAAIVDATQNFGTTKRTVNYYDVTDLSAPGVFDTPMFSVWTGYEDTFAFGFEDISALGINPANGTSYVLAFDSGPGNAVDSAGDTQGDFDLYKIDYQVILKDFLDNSRPMGTIYGPQFSPDFDTVNPAFGLGENEQHPDAGASTVFIDGAITKVGEVVRNANENTGFDVDIEYINPANLVLLDDEIDSPTDDLSTDHTIRLLQRVDTAPGSATTSTANVDPDPLVVGDEFTIAQGGFNGQAAESWESTYLTQVGLDTTSRSEPGNIAVVEKDGITGVWISEGDTPIPDDPTTDFNDEFAFFEIDLSGPTPTVTRREFDGDPDPLTGVFGPGFRFDENPATDLTTNDGDLDVFFVDPDGNVVAIESGFFDSDPAGQAGSGGNPAQEPRVFELDVQDYDSGDTDGDTVPETLIGSWIQSGFLPIPTDDDDNQVTDGRFAALDPATGYVFFFDLDSGGTSDDSGTPGTNQVVTDVFVFDPATNTFVYEQQVDGPNHFIEQRGLGIFIRGDLNGDGVVDDADIDLLAVTEDLVAGAANDLLKEEYDLTGDATLVFSTAIGSDAAELVREILGTEFGDANLDGEVNVVDLDILAANFGLTGGWAEGSFDGDGSVDLIDLGILATSFGFSAPVTSAIIDAVLAGDLELANSIYESAAVPEPASLALLAAGLGVVSLRRRFA